MSIAAPDVLVSENSAGGESAIKHGDVRPVEFSNLKLCLSPSDYPSRGGTQGPPSSYRLSSTGGIPMWKSMLDEAREVVWLASIVGGLSAIGVGLAVVVAVA